MGPHLLREIQVKLATVFEVPRKGIKSSNLPLPFGGAVCVCVVFLFFILLTSVGNSWREERKMTPSFMTQLYLFSDLLSKQVQVFSNPLPKAFHEILLVFKCFLGNSLSGRVTRKDLDVRLSGILKSLTWYCLNVS